MITIKCGFADWSRISGHQGMAAALVDRLTYNVQIVDCNWQSYRLRQNLGGKGAENRSIDSANCLIMLRENGYRKK